jgi:hypothetical protein
MIVNHDDAVAIVIRRRSPTWRALAPDSTEESEQ